ncbi:MAG: hypothetical protein RLZZ511_3751 [Cyanobacteriota bacterium]
MDGGEVGVGFGEVGEGGGGAGGGEADEVGLAVLVEAIVGGNEPAGVFAALDGLVGAEGGAGGIAVEGELVELEEVVEVVPQFGGGAI